MIQGELDEVARRCAKDVSALKIKLQERELQLQGGFGSSLNLALDTVRGCYPP